MRIAIVAAKLDPRHGGADAWTIALAAWLAARNHDVHLVGLNAAKNLPISTSNIHLLDFASNRVGKVQLVANWLKAQSFDLVHDMGLGCRFDIFRSHCGSLTAMERAKKRTRSLCHRIANRVAHPFAMRRRSTKRLASLQLSHPTASFVAVSFKVARDLHELEGIAKNRIITISNGVDTQRFSFEASQKLRQKARTKFSVPEGILTLAVMAHNHRLKGVSRLIDALRRSKDFPRKLHLFVVGGHGQAFRNCSNGSHSVTFTGPLDDPRKILAATDVYVHPTFYDACCLSVLEAMACGIATISSGANGSSERIVHGKSGFLLDDPADIDENLRWLLQLTDPARRFKFGNAARKASEAWTLDDNFLAIESLYRQQAASMNLRHVRRRTIAGLRSEIVRKEHDDA